MLIWLVLHSHNVTSIYLYYRSYDILNVSNIKYNNTIVYLIQVMLKTILNISNYSIIWEINYKKEINIPLNIELEFILKIDTREELRCKIDEKAIIFFKSKYR